MPLEHAILAFLDLEPQTGYDLKKSFDNSVANFWSATQSHIYKALENLEQAGLVESRFIVQEKKPNRKEYQITGPGRAELNRWLSTALPLDPVRHAWLIQVFFAHRLSNEKIAELLQARRQAILAVLKGLAQVNETIAERSRPDIPNIERMAALWDLTLDYGVDYYQSELAWLDKTLQRLPQLPPLQA